MRAYKPFTDRFDRILCRCPDCNKAWKTEENWEKVKRESNKQLYLDMVALVRGMKWEKPEDFRLEHYAEGYNQAVKEISEKIRMNAGKV